MGGGSHNPSPLRRAAILGVTVAAVLLAYRVYYPYSPAGRQERNLALAERHLPRIQSALAADPRFAKVAATVFYGNDGSLKMLGCVKSEEDLTALKRAVESTSPPVRLTWGVKVIPPPVYDEMEQP